MKEIPFVKIRLRMYFREIQKDGAISSWYLAQKFGFDVKTVDKDLAYAGRKGYLRYKMCKLDRLKINFFITQKGLIYVARLTHSEKTERRKRKELTAAC